MNEDQLRALVRRIVADRIASRPPSPHGSPVPMLAEPTTHPSHGMLRMAPRVEKGQPCLIEPEVACGLCGFCQSLGH